MDRVGAPAVEKPGIYGFRDDEISSNSVTAALRKLAIFWVRTQPDMPLSKSSSSAPLSATIEEYFHAKGPRQYPRDDVAAVVASYTATIDKALSTARLGIGKRFKRMNIT